MTVVTRFEFGDRVRHARKPEWGVGSVIKSEDILEDGRAAQRLSVRFSGAGLKALNTAHAQLERVTENGEAPAAIDPDDAGADAFWAMVDKAEWLAPVTERRVTERMTALPEAASDPFRPIHDRIAFTLDLYRFDRSGRGLVAWSVAQSGLEDPLTRFNRHELEHWFERWAAERDGHLRRLLNDQGVDRAVAKQQLAEAPAGAREVAGRR